MAQDAKAMPFPREFKRLPALPCVPVASAPLEVDPSAKYQDLPHFVKFTGDMAFVGGINKPKLIKVPTMPVLFCTCRAAAPAFVGNAPRRQRPRLCLRVT